MTTTPRILTERRAIEDALARLREGGRCPEAPEGCDRIAVQIRHLEARLAELRSTKPEDKK